MDLSEFLLARIAEDEALARDATDSAGIFSAGQDVRWRWVVLWKPPTRRGGWSSEHYDSPSPARVLAECEAKRGIVEECRDAVIRGESVWLADRVVLRLLALPFADHPDYRDEWRP